MIETKFDKAKVVNKLNQILEMELACSVTYTHYSFMIFGYNRIPITGWLRGHATECLAHANEVGELITSLGEHPSLKIGKLLETQKHDIKDILEESFELEKQGIQLYYELLAMVKDKSVSLEEYARKMISEEEQHITEIDKMLRKPGDINAHTNYKLQ